MGKRIMGIEIRFEDEVGYIETVFFPYEHVYGMGIDFKKIKDFIFNLQTKEVKENE